MTRALTVEEYEAVNKDILEVLEKHDCEIIVEAKMLIVKVGDINQVEPMPENGIPTPYTLKDNEDKGNTTEDTQA